MTYGREMLK